MARTKKTAQRTRQQELARVPADAQRASIDSGAVAERTTAGPDTEGTSQHRVSLRSARSSKTGSPTRMGTPPLVDLTDEVTTEAPIPGAERTSQRLCPRAPAPQSVQGVLIASRSPEEVGQSESTDHFAALATVQIPEDLSVRLPWEISHSSAALGVPLKITRWPSDNSKQTNNITLGLLMDPDPESEDFGRVKYKRMDGTMVVARTDGKGVSMDEVKTLLFYLGSVASEIQALVKAGYETAEERVAKAREFVEKKLTAAALQYYAKALA